MLANSSDSRCCYHRAAEISSSNGGDRCVGLLQSLDLTLGGSSTVMQVILRML